MGGLRPSGVTMWWRGGVLRAATRVQGELVMMTRNLMATRNLYAWAQPVVAMCTLAMAAALLTLSPRAPAATFTYTNPSCTSFIVSGTPPVQTVTCVSAGGGVPTCAPTANPAAPAAGGSTTISANCSNQPTAYIWTGGGCSGITAAACTVTKSRAGTVTYSVSAVNTSGTGAAAQISVTWK
jgi:hypothetical protein